MPQQTMAQPSSGPFRPPAAQRPRFLVAGLGHPWRGDDGLGLRAVQWLAALRLPGVAVREVTGDLTVLLDLWDGLEAACLVDAVAAPAGSPRLWRFAAHQERLPAHLFSPTVSHALGLPQVIELGRTLGRLPAILIVHGITGERFGLGEDPSPEALGALPELILRLLRELSDLLGRPVGALGCGTLHPD